MGWRRTMCEVPSDELKIDYKNYIQFVERVCWISIRHSLIKIENPFLVYVTSIQLTGDYGHNVLYYRDVTNKNFVDMWVPFSNLEYVRLADLNDEIIYKIRHDIY